MRSRLVTIVPHLTLQKNMKKTKTKSNEKKKCSIMSMKVQFFISRPLRKPTNRHDGREGSQVIGKYVPIISFSIYCNCHFTSFFMQYLSKEDFYAKEKNLPPFYCLSVSLYDDMHLVRDLKMNINHLVFAQQCTHACMRYNNWIGRKSLQIPI